MRLDRFLVDVGSASPFHGTSMIDTSIERFSKNGRNWRRLNSDSHEAIGMALRSRIRRSPSGS
jgi:hypothetical protein